MARILASLVLYLALITSVIADSENDETRTKDASVEAGYVKPVLSGYAYLAETFDEEKLQDKWILSKAKKDEADEDIAKYDGIWSVEEPKKHAQEGDMGLVLKSKARHAAVAAKLDKPFRFDDKPLVVQYEVNFQEGQECGGAYLKLLSLDPAHDDLKEFHDKTPYSIMFGPDKCGNDHKLHFIFRHKNPLNGTIEEKHCKKPKDRLEDYFKDKQPHLYTLIIRPDNSFEIKIDNKIINSGSLLDDFTPAVNPPLEIEDPADVQPEDWDDREKIPDPLATKPEDWDEEAPAQIVDEDDTMPEGWLEDEPPMIPNPDSVRPDDWDLDMDGEWEPPEIPNPKCADAPGCGAYKQKMKKNPRYKGKWLPPLINNPNYKGKWKPKLIHNPNYFNDEHPFRMAPIAAIGFELWSMSTDIYFDNIIITDDEEVARKWAADTFEIRRARIAEESWSVWRQIGSFTAEHPWIWAVYILGVGIPILLLVYCCCFTAQEKCDLKDEDKQPLTEASDEPAEKEKSEEQEQEDDEDDEEEDGDVPQSGPNDDVEEEELEDVQDAESEEKAAAETDEVIGTEADKPVAGGDGPRRRKPNKE